MSKHFRRGERVQLRELPGLVGVVLNDLSACTPPMVQVSFGGGACPPCVEVERLERVSFDTQAQDWRAAREEGGTA